MDPFQIERIFFHNFEGFKVFFFMAYLSNLFLFYCTLLNAGRLLTSLICEYLDWAQLNHTLKVYLPECNLVIKHFFLSCGSWYCWLCCNNCWTNLFDYLLTYMGIILQQKDSWKAELKEFSSKNGYDLNRNGDSGPLLLDVLEGFLKFEVWYKISFRHLYFHIQLYTCMGTNMIMLTLCIKVD